MIRTQVQIPDELYNRAKAYSQDREMSLAEVVRRGLELLLDRYPESGGRKPDEWVFPTFSGGLKVPLEDLKYYGRDQEVYRSLPHGDDDGQYLETPIESEFERESP